MGGVNCFLVNIITIPGVHNEAGKPIINNKGMKWGKKNKNVKYGTPKRLQRNRIIRFAGLRKYPCKKAKGEHDWTEPKYTNWKGMGKFERSRCRVCGKQRIGFISDK